MPKYFIRPFAESGDKAAVPNDTQVSNSVSYEDGWTTDYQKDLLTDPTAKPYPRDQNNQLLFDLTENIQEYQQYGVPMFITTADNDGSPFPYKKYAIVRYEYSSGLFRIYQSKEDANATLPTDVTKWKWLDPDSESVPAGVILPFGGTSAPAGYLAADGSIVAQATYPALFAAIGSNWNIGGEGGGNFRLPNPGGRTLVGSGVTYTGVLAAAVGSYGGAADATLVTHSHAGSTGSVPSSNTTGGGDGFITGPNDSGAENITLTIVSNGSAATNKNIQPSAVVFYIIKT